MQPLGAAGTLLGVLPALNLTETPFELDPGDLLLLYTDGAIEARPRPGTAPEDANSVFGEADLAQTLAATHGMDTTATIDHLTGVLEAHHHGWASDDTALLALRVSPCAPTGPPTGTTPEMLT